jgi:RNA polymerase sigma-70 factor, ECF subfamily
MATAEYVETPLSEIVSAIQAGSLHAQEELYARLSRGLRLLIRRKLEPQDVDDVLHTAFMAIVEAIRSGHIRQPEALMSFARTIIKRQISHTIGLYVQQRSRTLAVDPEIEYPLDGATLESECIDKERREYMLQCMRQLSELDRTLLHRFYVLEQSKEQICSELRLSATSFRLAKSRAKAKLTERVRRVWTDRAASLLSA